MAKSGGLQWYLVQYLQVEDGFKMDTNAVWPEFVLEETRETFVQQVGDLVIMNDGFTIMVTF